MVRQTTFILIKTIIFIFENTHSLLELQADGLEMSINGLTMVFNWQEIPFLALQKLDCKFKETTDRKSQW